MRNLVIGFVIGACIAGGVADAKKKPKVSGSVKNEKKTEKPPGDKSTNDGAQGRQNATEDAARATEGRDNSVFAPR